MFLEFNNQQIELDENGYLKNGNDWKESIATLIAEKENIILTKAHWEVIYFVRDFYATYETSPAMRALTKAMALKLGAEKANSRALYQLFPEGPAKQATKIAGLPKPVNCI